MAERPILFSGPMVRAILAGTKTQTRRVWKEARLAPRDLAIGDRSIACPYGEAGDRLWVRETWKPWPNTAGPEFRGPDDMGAIYAATWDKSGGHGWKPSIHMPRWASRITLEVVSIRVERLQDISEADARAEGIIYDPEDLITSAAWWVERPDGAQEGFTSARAAYVRLWDSINAGRGYGWQSNPWVWVVEFKRVQP